MTDTRAELNLNPSYIPPDVATPDQAATITSGDLPSTLSEASTVNSSAMLTDASSQTPVLSDLEIAADPDSLLNVPATTATAPVPTYDPSTYDAVTGEVGDRSTVQGQLGGILSEGGVLMDVARAAGAEYANARGGLNSSMGAEAAQLAMIKNALPVAQQDASTYFSQDQANQVFENQAGQFNAASLNEAALFNTTNQVQQVRDSILQSYQLQMENLSTANKSMLIGLEQKYSAAIQSDKNASDAYMQTIDSIGQLMSNSDLSVEQQSGGMAKIVDMLYAYLDFNSNLNSVNALTGDTTPTTTTDTATQTDAQFKVAKVAEYNQKVFALGSRYEAGQEAISNIPNGSDISVFDAAINQGYAQWEAAKAALDSQYAQWL